MMNSEIIFLGVLLVCALLSMADALTVFTDPINPQQSSLNPQKAYDDPRFSFHLPCAENCAHYDTIRLVSTPDLDPEVYGASFKAVDVTVVHSIWETGVFSRGWIVSSTERNIPSLTPTTNTTTFQLRANTTRGLSVEGFVRLNHINDNTNSTANSTTAPPSFTVQLEFTSSNTTLDAPALSADLIVAWGEPLSSITPLPATMATAVTVQDTRWFLAEKRLYKAFAFGVIIHHPRTDVLSEIHMDIAGHAQFAALDTVPLGAELTCGVNGVAQVAHLHNNARTLRISLTNPTDNTSFIASLSPPSGSANSTTVEIIVDCTNVVQLQIENTLSALSVNPRFVYTTPTPGVPVVIQSLRISTMYSAAQNNAKTQPPRLHHKLSHYNPTKQPAAAVVFDLDTNNLPQTNTTLHVALRGVEYLGNPNWNGTIAQPTPFYEPITTNATTPVIFLHLQGQVDDFTSAEKTDVLIHMPYNVEKATFGAVMLTTGAKLGGLQKPFYAVSLYIPLGYFKLTTPSAGFVAVVSVVQGDYVQRYEVSVAPQQWGGTQLLDFSHPTHATAQSPRHSTRKNGYRMLAGSDTIEDGSLERGPDLYELTAPFGLTRYEVAREEAQLGVNDKCLITECVPDTPPTCNGSGPGRTANTCVRNMQRYKSQQRRKGSACTSNEVREYQPRVWPVSPHVQYVKLTYLQDSRAWFGFEDPMPVEDEMWVQPEYASGHIVECEHTNHFVIPQQLDLAKISPQDVLVDVVEEYDVYVIHNLNAALDAQAPKKSIFDDEDDVTPVADTGLNVLRKFGIEPGVYTHVARNTETGEIYGTAEVRVAKSNGAMNVLYSVTLLLTIVVMSMMF